MKNTGCLVLSIVLLCLFPLVSTTAECQATYPDLFEEICQIVEQNFYDAALIQEKFPSIKAEYAQKISTETTHAEFSALINAMLKHLNASHTYYMSPADYEYYHLAAIFSFLPAIKTLFHNQEITYPTVGIITTTINRQCFIASVLPGSIAEQAGLLVGDEIVAVNGMPYQPIHSLKDAIGKQVSFDIRREPKGNVRTFGLTPKQVNPKQEMLDAETASIRIIEMRGKRIGYIHIYSYAGQEYHDELVTAISWGILKDADALIIDLRYGLGGADPTYLNIFNQRVPVLTREDRTRKTEQYDPQWRKPAVLLVNQTSRSGKEILAFGAKQYQLATVIGERTAGAVLGATLFPISNGDLLYLAGQRCLIDGVNLEGVGVPPDIEIPMDIRYCQGKDIQLERALEYLLESSRS